MNRIAGKALAAARSARLLYEAGDYDGCVNRAYYAMFDAARAYLKEKHGVALSDIKTHAGVLSGFSRLAIQGEGMNPDLGRALNRATVRRATADYDEQQIEQEAAARLLQDMDDFLSTVLSPMDEREHGR